MPSQLALAAQDVSVLAVAAVILVIIIVIGAVYLIVNFLRGVVDGGGRSAPPADECRLWRAARRAAGAPV